MHYLVYVLLKGFHYDNIKNWSSSYDIAIFLSLQYVSLHKL